MPDISGYASLPLTSGLPTTGCVLVSGSACLPQQQAKVSAAPSCERSRRVRRDEG